METKIVWFGLGALALWLYWQHQRGPAGGGYRVSGCGCGCGASVTPAIMADPSESAT